MPVRRVLPPNEQVGLRDKLLAKGCGSGNNPGTGCFLPQPIAQVINRKLGSLRRFTFYSRDRKAQMKFFTFTAIFCLLAAQALAQDPLQVAPQAYKLQFENEWVKVTRVHYAPYEKLPAHKHTLTAAAYVYLNDSGPVVFKHLDTTYGAITRPPTKAGSFRLYRSVQELHEVENQSDLPSDFLRVEFKTEPANENSLRGKFYREEYPAGENFQKVQFENEQIRITRLVCAKGKKIDVSTDANTPSLLIALSPATVKVSRQKGKAQMLNINPGQSEWLAVNQQKQFENTGKTPAEWLRFDFKTKALTKEEIEKRSKHEHPHKQ